MKPLSPYTHGFLDYAVGLLLVVSPWLLQFDDVSSVATITMVVIGLVVLGLSIATDYPLGLVKAVPFPTHGIIETIGAIVLVISPWVLGFDAISRATVLAVAVGLVWLAVVALTNYRAEYHRPIT